VSDRRGLHSEEPATRDYVDVKAAEVRADLADLRADMGIGFAEVRTDVRRLEARVERLFRQQTVWFLGGLLASIGAVTSLVTVF
jgi:hypothetical protein